MAYRILFLSLLFLASPRTGSAEEAIHYRIELLLLRHLDSQAEPALEPTFSDYSDALDLLAPEPELDDVADAAGSSIEMAPPVGDPAVASGGPSGTASDRVVDPVTGLPVDPDGIAAEPPPPAVYREEPAEVMQEAWRRLRLSAGFRPVLYFSWEQPDTEPFPLIRVHDDQLLFETEALAEPRDADLASAGNAITGAPEPSATGSTVDETAVPESATTVPRRFYRIDGTARLRRSRFLHLELDLAWNEPVFDPAAAGEAVSIIDSRAASVPATTPVDERPAPPAVRVFRLRQSRQVRTDQITYFDGSFMGLLAVITRIEAGDPEGDGETVTAAPNVAGTRP